MNILIIGPSWVGDMVMAQTLFICLKEIHPDCQIDVLAPAWSRPILERMPEVRAAIDFPLGHGVLDLKTRYQIGKQLKGQYQQAILLPNSLKSALVPFFAGIKKRTGWLGEARYFLLNDHRKLNKTRYPLMIERFMALAFEKDAQLNKPYPRPKLAILKDGVHLALAQLSLNQDKPILGLCPGAEFGPSKRWPSEYYAAVAKKYSDWGYQVWIFGSKKDDEIAQEIIEKAGSSAIANLAGKTALNQAIDLMSLCRAMVSNDSGLMHIGAALSVPMVAVYGSTSPEFTPPLSDNVEIVRTGIECSPCFERTCRFGHYDCLNKLYPVMVLKALEKLGIRELH